MTNEAKKVLDYLKEKSFNSAQETARDCGLDEAGLDAALEGIKEETGYNVNKGTRPDSYGKSVIWLSNKPIWKGR